MAKINYKHGYLKTDYKKVASNGARLFNKKIIDEQAGFISTEHQNVPEEIMLSLQRTRTPDPRPQAMHVLTEGVSSRPTDRTDMV